MTGKETSRTANVAHFEELQGRLRGLLSMVAPHLPAVTVQLVAEMIDANECGVALETVSEMLGESRSAISADVLAIVSELTTALHLPGVNVERLRPLVTSAGDDDAQ